MAATTAVSGEDHTLFKVFDGGRLLIAIIFLGTGAIFAVIWAKRQILRLYLINNKGPLEQAGSHAPKELRKEIEGSFNRISEMRLEPKLLSDQGQHEPFYSSFVDERDESSYKYRRKAFDLMSCLDELLCRVNISLARKPNESVRQQLFLLQNPPYSPFDGYRELCEKVTHLYEHARYGAKEFTEADYIAYSSGIDQLYDRVHQKFLVPGSLLINCEFQQQQMPQSSTMTSFSTSQPLVPSTLVEDKRLREISQNQII